MPFGGITTQYWALAESSFDAVQTESAGDGVNPIELSLTPGYPHEKLTEHTGTASLKNEVALAQRHSWSCQYYLVSVPFSGSSPDVGNASNLPDHDPLLAAAFPSRSTSAGTSHTYGASDTVAPKSLQAVRYDRGDDFYEVATGMWCETVEIDFSNIATAVPTITFSGGYATHGKLYGLLEVDGGHSESDDTIDVDEGDQLGVNALVKFGSEDNGGSGYRITAINGDTVTISPALAGDISDNDDVLPVVPASVTLANETLGGINSNCTIGGTSVPIVGGKVSFNTGFRAIDDEGTSDRPTGVFLGAEREVALNLTLYFKDGTVPSAVKGWSSTRQNVVVRVGESTAGKHVTINVNQVRFEVPEIKLTDDGFVMIELSGVAAETASGEDELELVFD